MSQYDVVVWQCDQCEEKCLLIRKTESGPLMCPDGRKVHGQDIARWKVSEKEDFRLDYIKKEKT